MIHLLLFIPMIQRLFIVLIASGLLTACNTTKQFFKSAGKELIQDSSLKSAHEGISVYYPASGKYLFSYQGDKYFVPASNTKLPTCYAAMKYLGDSLNGLLVREYDNHIFLRPAG